MDIFGHNWSKASRFGCLALALLVGACGEAAVVPAVVNPATPVAVNLVQTPEPDAPIAVSNMSDEDYEHAMDELFAKAGATDGPGAPALWTVSDYDSTVYLFGTVHSLRPTTQWLTPDIQAAFDASDRLIVEVDIHTRAAQEETWRLMRHYGLFARGRSLLDYMTDEQAETLKTVSATLDMPYENVVQLKPWLLKSFLSGEMEYERGSNAFERASGVEEVLIAQALRQGKGLAYIESLEDQLSVLPSTRMEDQIASLMEDLRRTAEEPELLDRLVSEWIDGDVEGLGLIISDPLMQTDKPYFDALLLHRNEKWIPKIEIMLDIPGTSFVAVGAAHLAGPDSVVGMLRAKGLDVVRQ